MLRQFARAAFARLSPTAAASQAATIDSRPSSSQVFTEFTPLPAGESGLGVFATRVRKFRIEPEAEVFVEIYRQLNRTKRYIQLYGRTRHEIGSIIGMPEVDPTNISDNVLLEQAVFQAKLLLEGFRNPIVVAPAPEMPDAEPAPAEQSAPSVASHASSAASPAATQAQSDTQAAPATPKPSPVLVVDGVYQCHGEMPWIGPQGQIGKPSFAVVLRHNDSDPEGQKYFGSDLERAVRESGVQPGDRVRLTKFPKTKVQLAHRVVHKNIWTLEILDSHEKAA